MIDYIYSVIYKDVKNVTIKIKPCRTIQVIVPLETSNEHIQKVLSKRDEWIHKQLDIFNNAKHIERKYISGEDFIYLGRRYRLKVINADHDSAVLKYGCLNLYCTDSDNFDFKKSLVENFYKDKAVEHFNKLILKYDNLFSTEVIFKIRKMKTRWGSCNPRKLYINLNQELIKKPKKAIEYVILHEIAHLKHHNHDRLFYNYLSAYMPDWRDVKYKLDYNVM